MTSTGFNDKATGEELQSLRNGLKMTCYVITELMCFYEDTISSQAEISSIANQGKRRKVSFIYKSGRIFICLRLLCLQDLYLAIFCT